MRTNLITRLKEEWNNLDPVDPLRGLIADAIDALAKAQPSKPLVSAKDAWMKRKRETFPKDYDESRFANWAENYRHEFMRGWNACALDHGIMSVPDGKGDA